MEVIVNEMDHLINYNPSLLGKFKFCNQYCLLKTDCSSTLYYNKKNNNDY